LQWWLFHFVGAALWSFSSVFQCSATFSALFSGQQLSWIFSWFSFLVNCDFAKADELLRSLGSTTPHGDDEMSELCQLRTTFFHCCFFLFPTKLIVLFFLSLSHRGYRTRLDDQGNATLALVSTRALRVPGAQHFGWMMMGNATLALVSTARLLLPTALPAWPQTQVRCWLGLLLVDVGYSCSQKGGWMRERYW
jgi:hypothetical protein